MVKVRFAQQLRVLVNVMARCLAAQAGCWSRCCLERLQQREREVNVHVVWYYMPLYMTAGPELYYIQQPMQNRSCAGYRFICGNNITALALVANHSLILTEPKHRGAPVYGSVACRTTTTCQQHQRSKLQEQTMGQQHKRQ